MQCRHCATPLKHRFLDLGFAPPSNAYLTAAQLNTVERYYPLRVFVCDQCWLVQTEDFTSADSLFDADYAYFSSTSTSWVDHARRYAETITAQLALDSNSQVVEIASNDGYLLQHFVRAGVPCLGIEPTASTAAAAERLGIPVVRRFFGEGLAQELYRAHGPADLIVGNNVYAHVPDINDFTRGFKALLKPEGCITVEFPHLLQLIRRIQFDTIYHEHFSYLSLTAVERIFESCGLRVWHVEELSTHGGSLRIYGCHADSTRITSASVSALRQKEREEGLLSLDVYLAFQSKAEQVKNGLLEFLLQCKRNGQTVVAYGAAAKGNTLLNFAGIKPDLLPLVCDAAVAKQGKFLPGSHIPIQSPDAVERLSPDFILILPWNLKHEITTQLSPVAKRGCRFVTAVPTMEIT